MIKQFRSEAAHYDMFCGCASLFNGYLSNKDRLESNHVCRIPSEIRWRPSRADAFWDSKSNPSKVPIVWKSKLYSRNLHAEISSVTQARSLYFEISNLTQHRPYCLKFKTELKQCPCILNPAGHRRITYGINKSSVTTSEAFVGGVIFPTSTC